MKKVFKLFLPILLLSIGFVSCEKDEDEDSDGIQVSSSELLGSWKLVEFSVNLKVNGESEPPINADTEQKILDEVDYIYLYFNENGSYILSEKKIELITEEDAWEEGEWEIKKGKLYFDGEKTPVTELTSNKMVWEKSGKETIEGDRLEYHVKYVFSKVK